MRTQQPGVTSGGGGSRVDRRARRRHLAFVVFVNFVVHFFRDNNAKDE